MPLPAGGMAAAQLRACRGAIVRGTFSLSHWLVVLAIVLLVFGAGRIPNAMGDLARGVRAFRAGMKDKGDEAGDQTLVEAPAADERRG